MTAIAVEAIERLTRDERAAVIDLWTEVYSQRPYIPGCVETAAQTRTIMAAIFDYGLQLASAELHGIREGGRLVCTSLRADTSDSPSLMTLTRFVARVTTRLRWRRRDSGGRTV